MMYANVAPKQLRPIPWGWVNATTSTGETYVIHHPGRIAMPDLCAYFDWTEFTVREKSPFNDFGTRDFKSVFTTAWRFCGFENLLLTQPDLDEILWSFVTWNVRLLLRFRPIYYFHIGDDFAGNTGLFMSPAVWRKWLAPCYAHLISIAHSAGCTVIFHSDGDIRAILDDLDAMLVDVLDYQPVGAMALDIGVGKLEGVVPGGRYRRMKLLVNGAEEQSLAHNSVPLLQRGTAQ